MSIRYPKVSAVLLRCPFCNSKAKYGEDTGYYQNFVKCVNDKCAVQIDGEWLEDETTIPRWNKRTETK